jgi:hypothetical protein
VAQEREDQQFEMQWCIRIVAKLYSTINKLFVFYSLLKHFFCIKKNLILLAAVDLVH